MRSVDGFWQCCRIFEVKRDVSLCTYISLLMKEVAGIYNFNMTLFQYQLTKRASKEVEIFKTVELFSDQRPKYFAHFDNAIKVLDFHTSGSFFIFP